MSLYLTCCGQIKTLEDRSAKAAKDQGQLEATKVIPELPADCRKKTRSGVGVGDRLDTALLKTDAALSAQHARTDRCAGWYDNLKAGLAAGVQ